MKICVNCGKEFLPKRERARFCSDLCRATFHQNKKQTEKKVSKISQELKEIENLKKGVRATQLFEELQKEIGFSLGNFSITKPKDDEAWKRKQMEVFMRTITLPEVAGEAAELTFQDYIDKAKAANTMDECRELIANAEKNKQLKIVEKALIRRECDQRSDHLKLKLKSLNNGRK